MIWQNYMVIGVVVLNLLANMRHRKFAAKAFEKGLFNNRKLLAKTLTDIAKAFSDRPTVTVAPVKYPEEVPVTKRAQPIEDAELVTHD